MESPPSATATRQSGSFPQAAAHTTLLQQIFVGLLLVLISDGLRMGQL